MTTAYNADLDRAMATPARPGALTRRTLPEYRLRRQRSALSPAGLTQIVRGVASQPRLWSHRIEYRADLRWYRRLLLEDMYELWLLSWLPGQHTGYHDHGDAAGAFAVVAGCLSERLAPRGRPEPLGLTLAAGSVRSFGRGHVHDVRNDRTERAVSIHAYSPPLMSMRRFGIADDGMLRVVAEERGW
jgi:hypothetical protein